MLWCHLWHIHRMANGQQTWGHNPRWLSCIITCFWNPSAWDGCLIHTRQTHTHTLTNTQLAALRHSWHLSDAGRAVDIFTTGAFVSLCLWWWGEHNAGESVDEKAWRGWGWGEEEGETRGVSKFRCSQLPEEHIVPGTKSQDHAPLPLLPSIPRLFALEL